MPQSSTLAQVAGFVLMLLALVVIAVSGMQFGFTMSPAWFAIIIVAGAALGGLGYLLESWGAKKAKQTGAWLL